MIWEEFIKRLLKDFRMSTYEMARATGISHPALHRLKMGKTKTPNQFTIKSLELGLNIRIEDSHPHKITYRKAAGGEEHESGGTQWFFYPIIKYIYNNSPSMFSEENIEGRVPLPHMSMESCFVIKAENDAMSPMFETGDFILFDIEEAVGDGAIVVARLKEGKQVIRRYKAASSHNVILYSNTASYDPIVIDIREIEAIYRAVGAWKKIV